MKNKVWMIGLFTLAGCGGVGPGYLLSGLVADSIIDGLRPQDEAEDGLHCWDLDANGECDEEEDANGDGDCDAQDCQGLAGQDGDQGDPGLPGPQGIPGAIGPVGPQGVSPPPVVVIVRPADDEPPYGNAWGSDGPHGNQERP